MEKKRSIGLIVLLVTMGAFAWEMLRPHEPMYDGKPLSFWLERYDPVNRDETSELEANHALRAIGTNAIPALLRMMRAKDSQLKLQLKALLEKQHVLRIKWKSAQIQRVEALLGLSALGGEAKIAVPTLMDLYRRDPSYASREMVLSVLDDIGPAAKNAVPVLAASLANRNDPSRMEVILTLGRIHADPEIAVPALIPCLQDPNDYVERWTVNALAQFGTDAKNAVPALKHVINDGSPSAREAVLRALKQIDPDSAATVGAEANQGRQ